LEKLLHSFGDSHEDLCTGLAIPTAAFRPLFARKLDDRPHQIPIIGLQSKLVARLIENMGKNVRHALWLATAPRQLQKSSPRAVNPKQGSAASIPNQDLLADRRHQLSLTIKDGAESHPMGTNQAPAFKRMQLKLVSTRGTVKPNRVIEAGVPEHILFRLKPLEAGMSHHHAFAGQIVRKVGHSASLHKWVGAGEVITDPHPNTQRLSPLDISTLKKFRPRSIGD
jgi:hypothetical protein